jgi:hypothetical protein
VSPRIACLPPGSHVPRSHRSRYHPHRHLAAGFIPLAPEPGGMTARIVHAAAAVLLGLLVVGVPLAAASHGTVANATTSDAADAAGNYSAPAGERFQGAVGVQAAEVEGEMETRTFGIAVATADTNESKAALIVERTAALEERLAELRRQQKAAQQARGNGSITTGEYRARIAALGVRAATVERLANRTARTARSLPAETLAEAEVNVTAIRRLARSASTLGGGETAEIARSIAGPSAGRELAAATRPPVPTPAQGGERRSPTEETATSTERPEPTAAPATETPLPTDTPTPTPTAQDDRTDPTPTAEEEEVYGWARSRWGGPDRAVSPLARERTLDGASPQQSTDLAQQPLLEVPLRTDGSGRVRLVLVFDLTRDSAATAFETLQEDQRAREDVRQRFRKRMASVAEQSESVTDRSMTVGDPQMALETGPDGETGIVQVSVTWDGLAAVEDDHLVVTEPFASGFTPDREFRVRITPPEGYRVTTTRPTPASQTNTSVAWPAGADLSGFTVVYSPANRTPLSTEQVDDLQPDRTITKGGTGASGPGFGPAAAVMAVLGGLFAARRFR